MAANGSAESRYVHRTHVVRQPTPLLGDRRATPEHRQSVPRQRREDPFVHPAVQRNLAGPRIDVVIGVAERALHPAKMPRCDLVQGGPFESFQFTLFLRKVFHGVPSFGSMTEPSIEIGQMDALHRPRMAAKFSDALASGISDADVVDAAAPFAGHLARSRGEPLVRICRER